jgi:hypothetical protein
VRTRPQPADPPLSRPFPCLLGLHAAALLLTSGRAPAQAVDADGQRRPTFVRVEDPAGQTVAGAIVTFAGALPHIGVDAGPRDGTQVQSDARGRAQAKLRPDLCYVAWAVGPADAAGARGVAPVHGWFGAGSLFTLRLGPPAAPQRLRITGADAWAARGPLQYFASTPSPGRDVALDVVASADGAASEIEVPLDPVRVIEVRTAAGEPLWSTPTAAGEDLVLPPPQSLRVRVRDEKGAPLAGALVRQRVARLVPWRVDNYGGVNEDRWRDLGRTDAEGACVVEVPYAADPLRDPSHGDLLLFATAVGRPAVAGGVFQKGHLVDDRKVNKIEGGELPFTCRAVAPLVGSIGREPRGSVAHLAAVGKLFVERNSYANDARSFCVPIGADGTFRFDDVPAELHSSRLTIVAPDGARVTWPTFPAMPARELPPEVAGRDGGLAAEDFTDLTVQVVEPGGGPARGAIVLLAPAAQPGVLLRDSALRLPLDARGAAQLRLVPGKWTLHVLADNGYAAQGLELLAGTRSVTLAMHPMARMRVEVRDANDRPVAGAKLVSRGTTIRGTGDPVQSLLQGTRTRWLAGWNALVTDTDGRVQVPFVPVEGVVQKLQLTWPGGSTPDFVLEAGEDWVVVRQS